MNLQRKLTLVVTTGAVALGAGHFVQERAADRSALVAQVEPVPAVVVSSVMPVAAGPADVATEKMTAKPLTARPAPADPAPAVVSAPAGINPDPAPEAVAAAVDCTPQFSVVAQPDAMLGLSLLAPCQTEQRVVVKHAGLAITARTSASGALVAEVPALAAEAQVEVMFATGASVSGKATLTDFDRVRRFAVQWQDRDAFQLHAFENGASYNQPGHISAGFTGTPGRTGTLTVLGDASVSLPLLAEVYTFEPGNYTDVILEAAVTADTCGRDILGETLHAVDGAVQISDLTMAMPACDAIGDILMLKNPFQDMTLAAAN